MSGFDELSQRSREIFQKLVEGYLETGDPVGSRTLSQGLSEKLSPATVRNAMSNLEMMGLLGSPHTSAGRIPTELGLRFFVDGLLEIKKLSNHDQQMIDQAIGRMSNQDGAEDALLERTGAVLSQISQSASLVFAKPIKAKIKQIDFVWLSPEQSLVILVGENGQVDNRLFTPPAGMTASDMRKAANFINAHIDGRSLDELQKVLEKAIQNQQREIDSKMAHLIEIGRAYIVEEDRGASQLIVRGRANLINEVQNDEEIEILRNLMEDLENKRDLASLLELSDQAQAVRVFIGSENKLFSLKSSSLVVSPYMNGDGEVIGAVGIIGPKNLNYARIVPIVNYTANLIGKFVDDEE